MSINYEDYYKKFENEFQSISSLTTNTDCKKFAVGEIKRFRSISGTILHSFQDIETNIDQRIISHILARSILENYFWLLYIFEGTDEVIWNSRYQEYLNGFKIEYEKFYNDQKTKILPERNMLEPAGSNWSQLTKPKNVSDILTSLTNDHGDRLDYLYFMYRLSSFDTHGKSIPAVFESAFNKTVNFSFLKMNELFGLLANQYLIIIDKLR